ncbi:MAG TPA: hypothetical protein VN969_27395 [Streptosporangiaceae bacterium]|jgi:hypothetical protein|nr:hypothetical protein [Streptosporangiaceae bacterium]
MNPHVAHDLVAQHLQDARTSAATARLGNALRAARRRSARVSKRTVIG